MIIIIRTPSSSQTVWSQDNFILLKIVDKPKEFLCISILYSFFNVLYLNLNLRKIKTSVHRKL